MIEHASSSPELPERTVVIGSAGFVGSAICRALGGAPVVGLGRADVDLLADGAADRLARALRPGDARVFVSAKAPAKTLGDVVDNIRMAEAVIAAVQAASDLVQLVYVSSDAVYADEASVVTEDTPAAASTLHGVMHRTRELALAGAFGGPICVLRPTLLYGVDDPHNGYGPNRFRRLASDGADITLFGEGEEQRDHLLVDDLAEVVRLVLEHRSQGVLNVASGQSTSFRAVAELAVELAGSSSLVKGTERRNPVTHRHFDVAALHASFPRLAVTELAAGMAAAQRAAVG
jgi:UDP-glucose 4-epimerase